MVVEKYTGEPVYLIDTGYKNIKITTPEDLELAELFLE
jgi:2-C-methyl-D-erythritol 4-phosphate cytidylyltransferase